MGWQLDDKNETPIIVDASFFWGAINIMFIYKLWSKRFYSRKFNSMESFLKAHSRYANRYNNIAQKVLNFKSPNQVITEYFMNQKA